MKRNYLPNVTQCKLPSAFAVFALLLILAAGNNGCRSYDKKADLLRVDSLQGLVQQASEIMVIDEDMIEKRADSINRKASFIHHNYKEKLGEEVISDLTVLMGIKSNYRHFLKKYPEEEYDNEQHKKRIDNLKKDLIAGRLSAAEFDKIYIKEKPVLMQHLEEVKLTARSVYQVENQYHRSSVSVNKFYEELKRKLGSKADTTIDKDEEEID